ncbi:MAG: FAD-dependent oxidoreductase [Candidatus Adiutrix intracellularis]|jgi:nitrite reductase (NADH) large subunit|nr:FAD-dependent oxidoreductase [Candidatus Adiutrix intracellularis]
MNIVIVGFGVAGATAAEAARQHNPEAYITIFSKENDLFYYRPRLLEVVSGQLVPDKVIVHPKSWYDERGIELRLGETLREINIQEKIVRGSTGSRQQYDRLLLAVGAESTRPFYFGDKLDGLYAVRSLNDAWSLNLYAKGKNRVVLIGSGLLGLELAMALAKQGLAVTVLERGDRILPRQTTPGSAELLRKKLAAFGLEFILKVEADRFEGVKKIEKVVLKNRQNLPADLVLLSAGITPNLSLATTLGLKIDKAIVVDQYLETSLPGIYAAGDCAQFLGVAGGLWTTSRAQGLVAGTNIAVTDPAARIQYSPVPPSTALKVAGIDLIATGDLDPEAKLRGVEVVTDSIYRKVVVDAEGCLVGFTNVGSTRGNRELSQVLSAKIKLPPETLTDLAKLDFDFARLA